MTAKPTYEELEQKVIKLERLEAERMQAKDIMPKEDFRYQTLFEAANDSIFIMKDFRFEKCNNKTLKIFGCEEEKDIIGFYPWQFSLPKQPDGRESKEKAFEFMNFALEGKAQKFYWKHIKKDGREFDAEISLNRLATEDTNLLQAIVRDITDSKQAERALQESEATLKSIFRAAPTGIGMVVDRVIKQANDRLCEMLGYSPEDLLDKNARMIYHTDEDFIFVGKEKYQQIRKKGTGAVETRWQKKDGTVFDVFLCSTPINPNDLSSGVTFTALDITDRKKNESALRESETRYRMLFNSTNDAILVYQQNIDGITGKFIEVNDVACRMHGYTREELLELSPLDLVTSEQNNNAHIQLKSIFSKGYSVFEITHKNKHGKEFPVEVNSHIFDFYGKQTILSIVRDITDRKRIEQERLNIEAHLTQAQRIESIGVLAGGIAHDFNNILTPILANAEMAMLELTSNSSVQENLQQIYTAGERAKDLVKQILTFARRTYENRMPLKISMIIEEAVKFLRSTIPSTIDIQYDFKTSQDTVLADPTQMNQIIMNLCTNSFHAMRDNGGLLKLTLNNEYIGSDQIYQYTGLNPGNYLKLSVSDTGSGIDADIIKKIFEPYYTTKDTGKGTGMGLAMVHGIVKKYQGDIIVESQPGKYTIFHILFPSTEDKLSLVTKHKDSISDGNERILIVDDEKPIVDFMQKTLEKFGYKVAVRTSSIDALEVFRYKPDEFDLVITDMTMPNMTGKELAMELRSIRPGIPIIISTGFSEQINEKEAKNMGINAFIMKPFHLHEIANTIREVLNKVKI